MRTPIAPNGLRRLIAARLFSRTQWRIWALAALVLAAYAVNIKLAVLYNDWNGRFFNALQAVNKAAIFRELFYFIGLAAAIIILLVWAGYIKDRLMLAMRRDLTEVFFKRWLSPQSAHYLLRESGEEPDNPDQRIAEDVRLVVSLSVSLAVSLYDSLLTVGSFSVILWQLSGSAEVWGFTIPGYMFWVSVLYTIVASGLTHLIGRKLKPLNINAQHMEANLRAALMEEPSCRCHRRRSCRVLRRGQSFRALPSAFACLDCFGQAQKRSQSLYRRRRPIHASRSDLLCAAEFFGRSNPARRLNADTRSL